MMEHIIGKKAKVRYVEKQKGVVRDTLADITKTTKLLKWIPKIKIGEGLSRQIQWMKSKSQIYDIKGL